jgi:hypothetical protein
MRIATAIKVRAGFIRLRIGMACLPSTRSRSSLHMGTGQLSNRELRSLSARTTSRRPLGV